MNFVITSPKFGSFTANVDGDDYSNVSKYRWVLDVRKGGRM